MKTPQIITTAFVVICIIQSIAYQPFLGKTVISTRTERKEVDIGSYLEKLEGDTCLILGTYAADFNAIEYAQRIRHYLPRLKEKGVTNFCFVVNARPDASEEFANILGIPEEVQIFSDATGEIGRIFGVSRGWLPDDSTVLGPYLKLFGMLLGVGAWATLPSVLGGYIGNPWSKQPWIEDALAQGQLAGRWPDDVLQLDPNTNKVITNKFTELPYVGTWGRRPLELATLRLQNMIGVSLKHWEVLKPTDAELNQGLLTQLGGLAILSSTGDIKYQHIDQGICNVCNFEDMLEKLKPAEAITAPISVNVPEASLVPQL